MRWPLRNAQMWGGLFWLAIGAYVCRAGYDMGLGRLHDPGSGFAPFWIGLVMCALAALVTVQALIEDRHDLTELWVGTRWPKVLLVTALLLVFGFFFEPLGFVFCSLVLLLVLMRLVDPVAWKTAIAVSFLATFGVWFALTKGLKIQLPSGLLSPWLG